MALWHLTWAAEGRLTFFPDEDACRRAVRALVRVVGPRAILFSTVDDHIHVVAEVEAVEVGRLCRDLVFALGPLTAVAIDPARVREVRERSHMERLVGYVLDQASHHGIPGHPALWTGSCFADLIGARVLPGFVQRLGAVLPRFRLRSVYQAVGLDRDRPLDPADNPAIRGLGATRLRDAASAALAASRGLSGKQAHVLDARTALVRLGTDVGLPSRELAFAAGIPLRSAQRLAHREVPDAVLRAVRLRLALEEEVRSPRPPMAGEPSAGGWGGEGGQEPSPE